jgi:putative ABC transport system permease protein
MLVVIRTAAANPLVIARAAQRVVWSVDPLLPVEWRSLAAMRDESLGSARFTAELFAGFAALALLLAAMGVYALVSYSVTLRTREIGLRMALGARPGDVIMMVVRDGARLAVPGLALGAGAAFLAARALGAILYRVPAHDATSMVAATLVLGTAALLASAIPARRASRVELTTMLRSTG